MLSLELIGTLSVFLALVACATVMTRLYPWRLTALRGTDQSATV